MDNIKNLIGTIMTSPQKTSPHDLTYQVTIGQNKSTATSSNGTENTRNRSDSECSNISDHMNYSNNRQDNLKRKDSESYFWIM